MPPTTTMFDKCTESDLKRFAICFLYCDRGAIDWNSAAAEYDSKVQVASFKTVTNRALKKILYSEGDEGDDAGTPTPAAKSKKATPASRKRKSTAVEMGGDDDDATSPTPSKKTKPKSKPKGKAKKSQAEVASDADDEDQDVLEKHIKAEDADDGEDNAGDQDDEDDQADEV